MTTNNRHRLYKNILTIFDFQNLKKHLTKGVKYLLLYFQDIRYKLKNLFLVNLDNGLVNLYSEYYKEALIRFNIMNFIWKDHSIVHYNIGRVHFYNGNTDKAISSFENAIKLDNKSEKKYKLYDETLAIFFLKKSKRDEEILNIPIMLKEEYYNYTTKYMQDFQEIISLNYQKLFKIYNHYIWVYVKNINETSDASSAHLKILELGSMTGNLGIILKKEYPLSIIHALDISSSQCEFIKSMQAQENNEEEESFENEKPEIIYKKIINSEMHIFLNKNYHKNLEHNKKTENTNESNLDLYLYDLILSMGTFSDFGQLKVILNLCAAYLKDDGLLIFYVNKSDSDNIQFCITRDYFLYSKDYLLRVIEDNYFEIQLIDSNVKFHNDEEKILLVLKKLMPD